MGDIPKPLDITLQESFILFLQLTQFISPRSKFPRWLYLPTNEIEAENAISIRDTWTLLPAEPMTQNWMEEINSTQSLDFDTIKLIQAGGECLKCC